MTREENNQRTQNVEHKKNKAKIPLALLFNFFLNLVFGFDLGFVKNLKTEFRPWVRFNQIVIVCCVTSILFAVPLIWPNEKLMQSINFASAGLQYVLSVIIIQFSDYNLFDLVQEMAKINGDFMWRFGRKLGLMMSLCSIIWFLLKSTLCVFHCAIAVSTCVDLIIPGNLICIASLFCDGVVVIEVGIYYCIYKGLKYLKEYLEKPKVDLQIVSKYYILVADCYDKIMPLYGKMVLIDIIIMMPSLLSILYKFVPTVKNGGNIWRLLGDSVFILHILLKFCSPAIIAEMANAQVDEIKRILNDLRIQDKYRENPDILVHLLSYLETRRLQHLVCGVLPLDLRLVVSIFSVTTTYFIVLIQFTHII